MKFDLLVINGDSFSDGAGVREQYILENKSEPDVFKIGWASFLSKKLNIPIINLSVGGTSNKSIINKTLRFLEDDTFYYHHDCSYPKIENFNLNNYKNILFITQWSFLHRFPVYIKNQYYELTPNMYNGIKADLKNDVLFEKYKEYFDLKFSVIDNETSIIKNFITDYFLYNSYLSTKKNITHYNWPYVPFDFGPFNASYDIARDKIKSFPYKLITNECVMIKDLKSVKFETDGIINDAHYGLHSSNLMADRLMEYLKKEYEEIINNNNINNISYL